MSRSVGWAAGTTLEPLLRRWADIVRIALCGTVCWLLIDGRAPAAYSLALISLTAIATRLARAPAVAELAFVSLLATDAWLTCFGLMAHIDQQDRAGHFLLTIAITPILAAAIVARIPRAPRSLHSAAGLAGLATLTLVVGWEVAEGLSDSLLLTDMSLSAADTRHDLMSGFAGATAGAAATAYGLARRVRSPGWRARDTSTDTTPPQGLDRQPHLDPNTPLDRRTRHAAAMSSVAAADAPPGAHPRRL